MSEILRLLTERRSVFRIPNLTFAQMWRRKYHFVVVVLTQSRVLFRYETRMRTSSTLNRQLHTGSERSRVLIRKHRRDVSARRSSVCLLPFVTLGPHIFAEQRCYAIARMMGNALLS